jgi:predicted dehydrogenase/threonine dehydrogenase-like Zn-dependent dehydrogenase
VPESLSRLAARAQEGVSGQLYRLGYTPKSLEETQRDVLWWVYSRVQAASNLRPRMLAGWGIAWTSAGYAELVGVDVPRPGRGRITIDVVASAVSPGTERAQYLRLPNAQVGVLGRPGYSASGRVRAVGPGVSDLHEGQLVAITGVPHASLATARAQQVFAVPDGVSAEQASLIMLGTICVHGADLAATTPGERVAVVGAGPIGILALRIATRRAGDRAVIATSHRGRDRAERSGAKLLNAKGDAEAVAQLAADVVIEATGDPQALATAVSAAAPGGRIVLLGSARGISRDLPLQALRAKRLQLIGAHVDTLDLATRASGADARREAGERFLSLVSGGELNVDDLVGDPIDPRRASVFYRELAEGDHSGGAHFDWTQLGPAEQARPRSPAKPPNVLGRGMETRAAYRPRRETGSLFELEDPLSGAEGRLRLGLVGCGDIAVQNASAAAAAPNVEIAACFDPIARLAEDLSRRHGARVARSQTELLSDPDVDAVLLCVPHDLHAPLAIEVCRAGKPVIVEKPLANNLTAALAMREAARENQVWLSTCFPQRYDPKVQVARRLIGAGALGDPQGTLTRLFLDKSPAYWRGGFSGRAQSDWRRSRERAGGGVLIMNLSHHLDLMRHLTGLEVETVSAFARPEDDIEELIVANLRYSGGALGSLVGGAAVRGSTEEALSLWGSEGRMVLEPQARVYTLRPLPGLRTTRWHSFGRLPPPRLRTVYFSRLASALAEGREPEVTADDGVAVQAIIEAAYRSANGEAEVAPADLVAEANESVVAG